jgi:hypothetical protein
MPVPTCREKSPLGRSAMVRDGLAPTVHALTSAWANHIVPGKAGTDYGMRGRPRGNDSITVTIHGTASCVESSSIHWIPFMLRRMSFFV